MSREQFRKSVFGRDSNVCVVPGCNSPAQDAHHIIDRSLWKDPSEAGGYLLDNGASLCGDHHVHAERNFFPPEACRQWAGIKSRALPRGWDESVWYNKWGDVLRAPTRELAKYPSTMYLPFSPEYDVSERGLIDPGLLTGKPLVVMIKMDGSNCCLSKIKVAARNGDTANHGSFDYIKAMHASVKSRIPGHLQVFGEWLYARHSIHYMDLPAYFQVFGVYDKNKQLWFSWDDVEGFSGYINLVTVPVIARLSVDEPWKLHAKLTALAEQVISEGHEGIVVRNAYPYHYGQFEENVAKYVRAGHVQTDKHWSKQEIVKNKLKSDSLISGL